MSWVYSLVWAVLPFFTKNRYALEGFLTSCSFDYISKNYSNRIVIALIFIGGFFLPLIMIVLFYILLVALLRKNEAYLAYQEDRNEKTNESHLCLNELNLSNNKELPIITVERNSDNFASTKSRKNISIYSKRDIKLIKMVCLIVLMFVIAWTPYAVVTFAAQFGSNIEAYINPYTTSLPALFAKASSIYNPLIYTLNNKEIRRLFFFRCDGKVPGE